MGRFQDKKWFYILLSILLAVVFWRYIRVAEDPVFEKTIRGVPIQIVGSNVLANQALTVADLSQDTVNVNVLAPTSVLDNLNRDNITATVDVSRLSSAGDFNVSINTSLPDNIITKNGIIQKRTPDTITVTIEKLYSKTFAIEFKHVGSVAEGYQAGTPSISPESVTISGPVEQVSKVAGVEAVLEAVDLKSRFSGDLPLQLVDINGDTLTGLEVKVSETQAYVTVPVVVVKQVKLKVNLIPGAGAAAKDATYEVLPTDTITVSGAEEDILGLEEIVLGDIDLSKVVGTSNFTFPVILDPSLENVTGISEAKVTVTVSGLETKSFQVSNISLINVPDGYTAISINEVRDVYVRGNAEALSTVVASQLRIVADLSQVTASGIQTVPAKAYLDGNAEVGVIGEYNVMVEITK